MAKFHYSEHVVLCSVVEEVAFQRKIMCFQERSPIKIVSTSHSVLKICWVLS